MNTIQRIQEKIKASKNKRQIAFMKKTVARLQAKKDPPAPPAPPVKTRP